METIIHNYELVLLAPANSTEDVLNASFSKLTETILLGVIAGRFPGEKLNWDKNEGQFKEKKANLFLKLNNRLF